MRLHNFIAGGLIWYAVFLLLSGCAGWQKQPCTMNEWLVREDCQ